MSESDLDDDVEAVDGEFMLALETAGELPIELTAGLHAELAHLLDKADQYSRAAQSMNTTRAYRSDWRQFESWCARYGLPSIRASPTAVALHLTSLADVGRSVSTIRRRCAAIARAHRIAGHTSPTADPSVMTVLEGIARAWQRAEQEDGAAARPAARDDRPDRSEHHRRPA